jgi:hypothetical protein
MRPGPEPHQFSRAWQCALEVADGRITGLGPATFEDSPALLVYTSEEGMSYVTVVTGWLNERPKAGPSTALGNCCAPEYRYRVSPFRRGRVTPHRSGKE